MKIFPLLVALLILVSIPGIAQAGWFDFGVGEIAKATGKIGAAKYEAQVKLALIQAIKQTLPTVILLVCLIGTVISGWAAAYLAMRLHDTARTALKDGTVTVSEWIIFGILTGITLPICLGLLWFARFLMIATQSGLSELMK